MADKVTNPTPAHEAEDVSRQPILSWDAAEGADAYNVYLAPAGGALALLAVPTGTVAQAPLLSPGTEYQWRVDSAEGEAVTEGDVWTFTTVDTAVQPFVRVRPSLGWFGRSRCVFEY